MHHMIEGCSSWSEKFPAGRRKEKREREREREKRKEKENMQLKRSLSRLLIIIGKLENDF